MLILTPVISTHIMNCWFFNYQSLVLNKCLKVLDSICFVGLKLRWVGLILMQKKYENKPGEQ